MRISEIIVVYLKHTGVPVLSEEGKNIPAAERRRWQRLWVVDPLDGTKEFIKHLGEFTINIALVENERPTLGAIFVPVKNVLYFGRIEDGSYRLDDGPIPGWLVPKTPLMRAGRSSSPRRAPRGCPSTMGSTNPS